MSYDLTASALYLAVRFGFSQLTVIPVTWTGNSVAILH